MKYWRKPFDQEERATKHASIAIEINRCKGCGYCVEYCPTKTLIMSTDMNLRGYLYPILIDESKCLGCGLCEAICPDFGICVIT